MSKEAAARLDEAARTRVPCAPVRDLLGSDVALAYEAQQLGIGWRMAAGARRVGYKVGLTSAAVQRQLGVDQPDSGVLLDDMLVGATVSCAGLLQPKAEAEVAFVLSAEPDPDDIMRCVDYACAAIEIVDSRIAGWDITITDTVADNASSGLFVLGTQQRALADFVPGEVAMTMIKNGEAASSGTGRDCLGDPLAALAWLARTRAQLGEPLQPGDVVLSGALGPMTPVTAGDTVAADLGVLGSVTATFG